jgi:hypothetical protein
MGNIESVEAYWATHFGVFKAFSGPYRVCKAYGKRKDNNEEQFITHWDASSIGAANPKHIEDYFNKVAEFLVIQHPDFVDHSHRVELE